MNDTAVSLPLGFTGATTSGQSGVLGTSIRVRIEETSLQADLEAGILRANTTPNNRPVNAAGPTPTRPIGVSSPLLDPLGDNLVTFGFEGNRLNVSGATTIANGGGAAALLPGAFNPVGSQGGVIPATRVPVPFWRRMTAATSPTASSRRSTMH